MRELIVFRHAKAVGIGDNGCDFDRPLVQKGRDDALRQADWMKESGLRPDIVLSSPAARALETAIVVCEHLGLDARQIKTDVSIYDAGVGKLLQVLEQVDDGQSVLLVGHNPGLAGLVDFLVGRLSPFTTACIAHITFTPPVSGMPKSRSGHLHALRDKDTGLDRG